MLARKADPGAPWEILYLVSFVGGDRRQFKMQEDFMERNGRKNEASRIVALNVNSMREEGKR